MDPGYNEDEEEEGRASDNEGGSKMRIRKGDKVAITIEGLEIVGTVLSQEYNGPEAGWYIELEDEKGRYRYWKQGQDGGDVRLVEDEVDDYTLEDLGNNWW